MFVPEKKRRKDQQNSWSIWLILPAEIFDVPSQWPWNIDPGTATKSFLGHLSIPRLFLRTWKWYARSVQIFLFFADWVGCICLLYRKEKASQGTAMLRNVYYLYKRSAGTGGGRVTTPPPRGRKFRHPKRLKEMKFHFHQCDLTWWGMFWSNFRDSKIYGGGSRDHFRKLSEKSCIPHTRTTARKRTMQKIVCVLVDR